jgi:hypothetical protein
MAARKNAPDDQSRTAMKPTATAAARVSRGPVDAPGKRHRKPLPPEPIGKQMGEPRGRQMEEKSLKTDFRTGRGSQRSRSR